VDTEFFILGMLAMLIVGSWFIVSRSIPPNLEREMADQVKKSADTIRGGP
jgi:hypothetical protein